MDASLQRLVQQGGGKMSKQAMAALMASWDGAGRPYGLLGQWLWFVTALAHGAGEVHVRPLPAQEFFCPACELNHPLAALRVEHTRAATRFSCPCTGELLCEV